MSELKCECVNWATTTSGLGLVAIAGHHENCEHYPGNEVVLRGLIHNLIKGIETWAADEDDVHDEVWEAYRKAKFLIDGIIPDGASR